MSELPIDFFLGNLILSGEIIKLDPGRFPKGPTCWAYATATLITDTLILQENLNPILLASSLWIASIRTHICRLYSHLIPVNCEKKGIMNGFNYIYILYEMERLNLELYVKLESCFPQEETLSIISSFKDNYFGDEHNNCCIKNINIEKQKYKCLVPEEKIDKMICDFKIRVKKCYSIKLKYSDINGEYIKYHQNIMKTIIYCRKKPLITKIYTSEEFYNNIYENNRYYIPTKKNVLDEISGHAVVIYGWEKNEKNGQEYWIIKDSNCVSSGNPYYKIPFSTMQNKDNWIGCDTVFSKDNKTEIMFVDVESNQESSACTIL